MKGREEGGGGEGEGEERGMVLRVGGRERGNTEGPGHGLFLFGRCWWWWSCRINGGDDRLEKMCVWEWRGGLCTPSRREIVTTGDTAGWWDWMLGLLGL
jgi:hypothetical protein